MRYRVLIIGYVLSNIAVTSSVFAESRINVTVGDISQQTAGSNIKSEISIGSVESERVDDVDIGVSVNNVSVVNDGGRSSQSLVNIGAVKGKNAKAAKSRVAVGGKIILIGEGEINIGTQTPR